MEKGLAFLFDIENGVSGTAAFGHQALCTAITTRLNVYFKRSKYFRNLRAYQETRTDNSTKDYIVPDVLVKVINKAEDDTEKRTILMIEVCHTNKSEDDFNKMIKYLEEKNTSCEELFVIEYDKEPIKWYRKRYEKDCFSKVKYTSYSQSIKFNLDECVKWFED